MIKTFKKDDVIGNTIRVVDTDTGIVKVYSTDKNLGFPFGIEYTFTMQEMGYNDVSAFIKELKSRNFLGEEVDNAEQKESDRLGYINLGVERIKRAGRVNTSDFEDVCNKLSKYGMGLVDAQNCIIAAYENQI